MPPSLALIFRHRLDSVWGDVFTTFFTWTHCVAMPRSVSPTLFTSAGDRRSVKTLAPRRPPPPPGTYRRPAFSQAG